jgi:hypothetical protein
VDSLDDQLDRLYALDPGEFVVERDRLVKELRAADRREEASEVGDLRKPSVSAWAINQLARQDRRDVDLLLDAGHRLRDAQQRLMKGEAPEGLDEARRIQREALQNLSKAARGILAGAGRESDVTLARIASTLQAAAIEEEGRELLARGRLTRDLDAPGFDLLAPMAGGATPRKRAAKPKSTPAKSTATDREREKQQLEEARSNVREARAALREAEKELRAAEQAATRARRELDAAEAQVEKREAAIEAARQAVEEAEGALREAQGKG